MFWMHNRLEGKKNTRKRWQKKSFLDSRNLVKSNLQEMAKCCLTRSGVIVIEVRIWDDRGRVKMD